MEWEEFKIHLIEEKQGANLIDKAAVKMQRAKQVGILHKNVRSTALIFEKWLNSPLHYHSYDSSFLAYC